MRMYHLLAALIVGTLAHFVYAGDVITRDDGSYAEAPAGYKAIFVPKNTPAKGLISVRGVKVVVPEFSVDAPSGDCTKPGELSLGGAPCKPEYDFYDSNSDGVIDLGPRSGCEYDPYNYSETMAVCYRDYN